MNDNEYLAKLKLDYPDFKISEMGCCSFWIRNKGNMLQLYTTYVLRSGERPEITGVKAIIYNCYDKPDLEKFIKLLKEE